MAGRKRKVKLQQRVVIPINGVKCPMPADMKMKELARIAFALGHELVPEVKRKQKPKRCGGKGK